MKNFAIIENGSVVNVVVATLEFAQTQNWIEIPEGVGIGWQYANGSFTNPNAPSPEDILEDLSSSIRADRNLRLADCDWTQLPDAPVDAAAWATYRQSLRDISKQVGFPSDVQWPDKPE